MRTVASADVDTPVFSRGPTTRLQRALAVIRDHERHLARRATAAVLVTWTPLAILSLLGPGGSGALAVFFTDIGAHARYLVAVPALIFAEADCLPRFDAIAHHFARSGLIVGKTADQFATLTVYTRRLLDSRATDVVLIALAYTAAAAALAYVGPMHLASWQGAGSAWYFSPAGWWHALVSLPLLLLLLIGWSWRLMVWTFFLERTARLDLQLIAAHPDRVGGLRFVSTCLRGFRLIALALGSIVAGSLADTAVSHGMVAGDLKRPLAFVISALALLFGGPLVVFIRAIRERKRCAFFTYGAFTRAVGQEFEAKWLRNAKTDGSTLEVPDFSATADLYSLTANVYAMRDLPFDLRDLISPLAWAAVPFLPLVLFLLPLQEIFDALIKALL